MSFVIVKECEIYDIPRGWNNPQGWDGESKKILKKQVTGGGIYVFREDDYQNKKIYKMWDSVIIYFPKLREWLLGVYL